MISRATKSAQSTGNTTLPWYPHPESIQTRQTDTTPTAPTMVHHGIAVTGASGIIWDETLIKMAAY